MKARVVSRRRARGGRRLWQGVIGAALAAVVLAAPGSAQEERESILRTTRAALEAQLGRYESAAESPAYSEVLRARAAAGAARIRQRLEQGDFRPGDRVFVGVEGYPALTDTFVVTSERTVILPGAGELALAGVLRSELQATVAETVARTIRNPRVSTGSMIRLFVDGGVAAPGSYLVSSDAPLSDVLMLAGGHTRDGKLESARMERAGETLLRPDAFQSALRVGSTVDQLGLREGDRLVIPIRRENLLLMARELVLIIPAALGLLSLLT